MEPTDHISLTRKWFSDKKIRILQFLMKSLVTHISKKELI